MTTYKLVPVEPTTEMVISAYQSQGEATSLACEQIYRAMLAAAPIDPTDPGHDIKILREHVRHLERRVRQLSAVPKQPEVWRSHGREDTMRRPEESDVSGGATDCVTEVQGDALEDAMGFASAAADDAARGFLFDGHLRALRAHLAPIVADAERWRNREVQAEPVAWQPITTAPAGVRVLLGPRDAPVVGVVCKAPDWSEDQEPTCRVVHYNGNTLVSNYRCSEWAPLHAATPAPCVERAALIEGFYEWWDKHGQYCRAGGGQYEKTFAFRAWEAALDATKDQP